MGLSAVVRNAFERAIFINAIFAPWQKYEGHRQLAHMCQSFLEHKFQNYFKAGYTSFIFDDHDI